MPTLHPWCRSSLQAIALAGVLAGCSGESQPASHDSLVPESESIVATFASGSIHADELATAPRQLDDPDADWRVEAIRDLAIRQSLLSRDPTPLATLAAEAAARQATRGAMLQTLSDRLGWSAVTVSEDEIRAHYDDHPDQYKDASRLRLQHVYLRADRDRLSPDEIEAVRQRAVEIHGELVAGADFTSIARRSSESETAFSGGHVIIKSTDRVEPAFADAAWRLEEGEISEVVEVSNGFHILTLRQRIEERDRPFDEARPFAETRAVKAKVESLQRDWLEETGPRYDLETHYELLEDPLVDFGAGLITHRDGSYTVSQLAADLPTKLQEHFYQGYLPQVHDFLDQAVLGEILYLEARALGLESDPQVVEAVEDARQQALYQAALDQLLSAKVRQLPVEELEEFYWQNEERYKTLRTVDMTLIHLPLQQGKSLWDLIREGEVLAERVRQGESMEQLARQHSRHYSAATYGRYYSLTDVGVRERVQSSARFRRQLDALAPGELDVFRSESFDSSRLRYVNTGAMVFRLDREVPPELAPFEEVTEMVRQNYLRRHYQRFLAELRAELAEQIDLEIFMDRLPAA